MKLPKNVIFVILAFVAVQFLTQHFIAENQLEKTKVKQLSQKSREQCTSQYSNGTVGDIANCINGEKAQPFEQSLRKITLWGQLINLIYTLLKCSFIFYLTSLIYQSKNKLKINLRVSFGVGTLGLILSFIYSVIKYGQEFLLTPQLYAWSLSLPNFTVLVALHFLAYLSLFAFIIITLPVAIKRIRQRAE